MFTKLIERNTTIPTKKNETFTTAVDNQPSVEIHILQGERPMAQHNKTIGKFHLDSLPPAQRGVPQIEVTFDIDANGILSVTAKDKGTGKEQSIRIEASSGLSDAEIEKMKHEAQENEESDKQAKEKIDKMNKADSLIFQTEKQLKEFGEKIPETNKKQIEEVLNKLKEAHKKEELEEMDKLSAELQQIFQQASEHIYNAQNQGGGQQGGPEDVQQDVEQNQQNNQQNPQDNNKKDDDEVTDVDFEEVK